MGQNQRERFLEFVPETCCLSSTTNLGTHQPSAYDDFSGTAMTRVGYQAVDFPGLGGGSFQGGRKRKGCHAGITVGRSIPLAWNCFLNPTWPTGQCLKD
jgi:hypothetical protein